MSNLSSNIHNIMMNTKNVNHLLKNKNKQTKESLLRLFVLLRDPDDKT